MPLARSDLGVHNGTYTVYNPQTRAHRTFRLRTWDRGDDRPPVRVLELLTGADNSSDYTGFAFVPAFGHEEAEGPRVWGKFRGLGSWDQLAVVFWSLATEGALSRFARRGLTVRVAKTCLRCNRLLTHPESLRSGYGPECEGRP